MFNEPQSRKILLNALVWAAVMLITAALSSGAQHRSWLFLSMIVGWTVTDQIIRRSGMTKDGC